MRIALVRPLTDQIADGPLSGCASPPANDRKWQKPDAWRLLAFCYSCVVIVVRPQHAALLLSMFSLCSSCADRSNEAGLAGANRVVAITLTSAQSEPFFTSKITIDRTELAKLEMTNGSGKLPTQTVRVLNGSFEKIAIDLAQFRQVDRDLSSGCRGNSDSPPITVRWHYESGAQGSYSARPGCPRPIEKRFMKAAQNIAKRVGFLETIRRAS